MNNTKLPLCRCNNCNGLFIDKNPNVNQPLFEVVPNTSLDELEILTDKDGTFWGCPNCETNGYLQDVNNTLQLSRKEILTNLVYPIKPY